MNYYEALSLSPQASNEEIEEAYRLLARKVHPDLNQQNGQSAEAQMKLLNQIRDTLTDPQRRAAYDLQLATASCSHSCTSEKQNPFALYWKLGLGFLILASILTLALTTGWLHWKARVGQGTQDAETPFQNPASIQTERRDGVVVESHNPLPAPNSTRPGGFQQGKKSSPQVVKFGSSLREVTDLLGQPDSVEEFPSTSTRILHYGRLRLIIKDGKIAPGSGME